MKNVREVIYGWSKRQNVRVSVPLARHIGWLLFFLLSSPGTLKPLASLGHS